ncbi:YfjI family protein [Thermus thermophilus]|uniref:YfjI family protein n=1 Tax=Thermus thermophilus TaxID=274 RepID=UPI0021C5EB3B|nr:YfjI family protein [Thermus thermophilus]
MPDKAIGLDFDRTPPEGLRPLLDALSALGTPAYSGPGNTRGSRVWIFLEEPQEDLEALAKGLARVARLLLGPEHAVEAYPNGTRGLFLPLYGFLNGQPRPLYEAWSGQRVGLPFQPRHADPEALRRLVRALGFLEVALQGRPSGPRHDAALTLLNLAHRAGVLEEAKGLLGAEPVYRAWGLEDSRTLEAWQEELARLAEAAASPEYDHKRGLPFLKEVGLDPAPLASLLGEVREREEWPEPLPLDTLEAPLPPWPRGLLPPALEDLAEALGEQFGLDATPFAMAAMTCISAVAAHRGALVVAVEGWEEPLVLWTALVGPPGSGKTPLIHAATRPVWAIEKELAAENEALWEAYERELQEWKQAKGEGGERPKPPKARRLVVGDATPEKVGIILSENPGVLVELDELAWLLLSWRRQERGEGRKLFLSAYNGKAITIDRVMRGTLYLERPQIALLGGIQVGPWHQVVGEALRTGEGADGLLQRIVPVVLRPRFQDSPPPPPPREAFAAYTGAVRRLWEGAGYGPLHLTADAWPLWEEWRAETRKALFDRETPESWKGYLAKRVGLSLRLAGVLALVWGERAVSRAALGRAILLLKGVLEPHMRAAWGLGELGDLAPAYRLARFILKHRPHELSFRRIYSNRQGGLTRKEEAKAALDLLERAAWLAYDPAGKVYRVNPRVWEVGHAD